MSVRLMKMRWHKEESGRGEVVDAEGEAEETSPSPNSVMTSSDSQTANSSDPDTKINDNNNETRKKKFILIEENEHLCPENKKFLDQKAMRCNCSTTEDDRKKGIEPCSEDAQCPNRLLNFECDEKCRSGELCTNQRFQKRQYAECEVRPAGQKGDGLFAAAPIKKGQFIMEYIGEVIDAELFQRRISRLSSSAHHYFMALSHGRVIDASKKGAISRYINHSCDPNARTEKWTIKRRTRIGFFALRDIAADEEITFNYQFDRSGHVAQKCHCGSENCTGWLGPDEKTAEANAKERKKDLMERREKQRRHEAMMMDKQIEADLKELLKIGKLRNRNDVIKCVKVMLEQNFEEMDNQMKLLDILVATPREPGLRHFLHLHGPTVLWMWLADDPNVVQLQLKRLRSHVLDVVCLIPFSTKNQVEDSHLAFAIERLANLKRPHRLLQHSHSSSSSTTSPSPKPCDDDQVIRAICDELLDKVVLIVMKQETVEEQCPQRPKPINTGGSSSRSSCSSHDQEPAYDEKPKRPFVSRFLNFGPYSPVVEPSEEEQLDEDNESRARLILEWFNGLKADWKIPKKEKESSRQEDYDDMRTSVLDRGRTQTSSSSRGNWANSYNVGKPGCNLLAARQPQRNSVISKNRNRFLPRTPTPQSFVNDHSASAPALNVLASSSTFGSAAAGADTVGIRRRPSRFDQRPSTFTDNMCERAEAGGNEPLFKPHPHQPIEPLIAGTPARAICVLNSQDGKLYWQCPFTHRIMKKLTLHEEQRINVGDWKTVTPMYLYEEEHDDVQAQVHEVDLPKSDVYAPYPSYASSLNMQQTTTYDTPAQMIPMPPSYGYYRPPEPSQFFFNPNCGSIKEQARAHIEILERQIAFWKSIAGIDEPPPPPEEPQAIPTTGQMSQAAVENYDNNETVEMDVDDEPTVSGIENADELSQIEIMNQFERAMTTDADIVLQRFNATAAHSHMHMDATNPGDVLTDMAVGPTITAHKPMPVLPPGWAATQDAEGSTYYYDIATRETQWDFPTAPAAVASTSAMAASTPRPPTPLRRHGRTTTAAADTSSESVIKKRTKFKETITGYVKRELEPLRKAGRFQSNEDFKYLLRTLVKTILSKEEKLASTSKNRHVQRREKIKERAVKYVQDHIAKHVTNSNEPFARPGRHHGHSPDSDNEFAVQA